MILGKYTPVANIVIWQPRWKDKTVMIAKYKVQTHNKITFTKYPKLDGEYYLSAQTITKYPLEPNGKILCYSVPLDELEPFERATE